MANVTVTGQIGLPNGSSFVGTVVFTPVKSPLFHDVVCVFTQTIEVTTDSDGQFSQEFEPGHYDIDCVVGGRVPQNPIRRFRVVVPWVSSAEERTFSSLRRISGVAEAEDFADNGVSTGGSADTATTTVFGTVKLDQTDATAVVMTKKTFTGSDAKKWLFRPVAGRLFGYDPVTGYYFEVEIRSDQGVPGFGIIQSQIAFADLPAA